jgi:hypothetical protein
VIWNPGDPGVDMLVLITGKLHVKSDAGEIVGQSCRGATALSLWRESLRSLW